MYQPIVLIARIHMKNLTLVLILTFLAGCQVTQPEPQPELYRAECHGIVSLVEFIRMQCHIKGGTNGN